jgi:hypothetical protein
MILTLTFLLCWWCPYSCIIHILNLHWIKKLQYGRILCHIMILLTHKTCIWKRNCCTKTEISATKMIKKLNLTTIIINGKEFYVHHKLALTMVDGEVSQNVEVLPCTVSTFILLFGFVYFLNKAVLYSPDNICKWQLSNSPRWNANQKDGCPLFHTIYLLKICAKRSLHYFVWISMQPRMRASCTDDIIMIKKQNIIHKLCLYFQLSAKLYMVGMISW